MHTRRAQQVRETRARAAEPQRSFLVPLSGQARAAFERTLGLRLGKGTHPVAAVYE